MARKPPRRGKQAPAHKPANDNGERQLSLAVIGDWPIEVGIGVDELVLFETYMADLVAVVAANDNEPED